jgi:DeoR/GlpR family transcriptional regulator of sugar metabolism
MGKKGGYRRGTKKTEEKILQTLTRERILDTETLCLKLRILPGTIREGLRNLLKDGKIEKIKEGKKFYWKIK